VGAIYPGKRPKAVFVVPNITVQKRLSNAEISQAAKHELSNAAYKKP
jgi:hypothetical protein